VEPDGDVISLTYNNKTHTIALRMDDGCIYVMDLADEQLLASLDYCLTMVADGTPELVDTLPSIAGMTFHENGRLASLMLAEPCTVTPGVLGHIMAGHPVNVDDLVRT
jgi:hypothetical protein